MLLGINLAFLFFMTRMIPESSRWLMSQGKYDDGSVGQIEVIVRKGNRPSMTNSIQLSLIKDMLTDYYPF
jgi:hypothetical protein